MSMFDSMERGTKARQQSEPLVGGTRVSEKDPLANPNLGRGCGKSGVQFEKVMDLMEANGLRAPCPECIAKEAKIGALVDAFNEQDATIKELVAALEGIMEYEPEHCPCGSEGCASAMSAWKHARAALAKARR